MSGVRFAVPLFCDTDFDCTAGWTCDPECGGGTDAGPGTVEIGEDGDACTCDPDPAAGDGVGRRCAGTDDGCVGFGGAAELYCLAESRSGNGVCGYPCSLGEVDCPSGYSCVDSALMDGAGSFWMVCVR